jgi:hypothetical protein
VRVDKSVDESVTRLQNHGVFAVSRSDDRIVTTCERI